MLRYGAVAALLVLVVGTVASCGGDSKPKPVAEVPLAAPGFASGSKLDKIQKAGKFVVGVPFNQDGFGRRDTTTGALSGFDIEIAKDIAHRIFGGLSSDAANRVRFVEAVSSNREAFLRNGSVDAVVSAYPIDDQRKAVVDFAGPYYVAHGSVMVRASDKTIASVGDLNGKNVCTVRNSSYVGVLASKAPLGNVTTTDTYGECRSQLQSKQVDAVVADNGTLASLAHSAPGLALLNVSITDEPYGIGIARGDNDYRKFLNDQIEAIEADGEWARAFDTTLGTLGLARPQPPAVDRYQSTSSPQSPETTETTSNSRVSTTTSTSSASSSTSTSRSSSISSPSPSSSTPR